MIIILSYVPPPITFTTASKPFIADPRSALILASARPTYINVLLNDYATGFEMSPDGEILSRDRGYETLLDAKMPPATDPMNVAARVEKAVRKFRRHSASRTDKREVVRLLADSNIKDRN